MLARHHVGQIDVSAVKMQIGSRACGDIIPLHPIGLKLANNLKRTEVEKLKAAVTNKLTQMVKLNKSRLDYLEKFKEMIEAYNKGMDVQKFFDELLEFIERLEEEE